MFKPLHRLSALALSAALMLTLGSTAATAQKLETLNRGLVAVKASSGVFVSWRLLASDDEKVSFDLYRDGVLVNTDGHLASVTNYTDKKGTTSSVYTLKTFDAAGNEIQTTELASVWTTNGLKIPLETPAEVDGLTADGSPVVFSPNDITVGDVDGDGEYELILKWDPSNAKDNSQSGVTSRVYIDCLKLNGTRLWRLDLGRNIRAGAHYTQMACFDFDGNGKAELMVKTAPGSKDGLGRFVSEAATDDAVKAVDNSKYYGNSSGYILSGPEMLTVFDGETGAAVHTIPYLPARDLTYNFGDRAYNSKWGDKYGNRGDRFLCGVAHLDDAHNATAIFCRGYYTQAFVWAVDFDGSMLSTRWRHESLDTKTYSVYDAKGSKTTVTAPRSTSGKGSNTMYGNGNHNMSVADVDADGYDEIIWGSAALDHDGRLLYATGYGHGDAIHLGDFDPTRPGLELFTPHEDKSMPSYDLHDAATGELLYVSPNTGVDNGRGMCAQVSPTHYGACFSSAADRNQRSARTFGIVSAAGGSVNGRIYWDGDLQDELLDGNKIDHFDGSKFVRVETPAGNTCNGSKNTPCFSGDILGDWREELVLWTGSGNTHSLIVYTTTIPTQYRVETLAHDHTYRMAMAWQNSSYNQPPHVGYYLPDLFFRTAVVTPTSPAVANQTVTAGAAIEPISFRIINASGAEVTGLAKGLTVNIEGDVVTISGKPEEVGAWQYCIVTTGMDEGASAAKYYGTITVAKPEEPAVLTLLARYAFDGSTLNSVSNAQAAATDFTASYASGANAQAISFGGSPATARLAEKHYDQMSLGQSSFTMSLWFNSTQPAAENAYLFHTGSHAKNDATGATGKWMGLEYKNGNLYFSVDDDVVKSSVTYSGASSLFDGKWHNVVCIRNVEKKMLYIYADGVLKASVADQTGNISQTEDIVIGNCNVNFNTPYKGLMDELDIWQGAMTATQVGENFETPFVPSAITDVAAGEWVRISPAADGRITVDYNTPARQLTICVYSLGGTLVAAQSVPAAGLGSATVSVASLPQNLYVVRVTDGTRSKELKLKL